MAGPEARRFAIAVLLVTAYGASIGGVATLVGTPPNLVLVRIFSIHFPRAPEINFAQWMELDLHYIDNWSLWHDLKIVMQTIPAVILGKGAR